MRDAPNNRFPGHFRDFIEELNKHNVEYLLIGGYAMGRMVIIEEPVTWIFL